MQNEITELAISAFSNAIAIIKKVDNDKKVIYVNLAFEKTTGYTSDEVLERPPFFLQNIEDLKLQENIKIELQIIHKNGEISWGQVEVTLLKVVEKTSYFLIQIYNLPSSGHDLLGSLPNRFIVFDRLQQAITQARTKNLVVGLLCIEIDHFKSLNESYTHEKENEILKLASIRLKSEIRDDDTLAYISKNEFALIIVTANIPEIFIFLTERLLNVLSKPYDLSGQEIQLSFTVGISIYPYDGYNAQLLIKNAEIALYRAKQSGGNHFEFYNQEMNTPLIGRSQIENQLHLGIQTNQFFLEYQPIYSLHKQKTTLLEALIRWNHPLQGLIYPIQFIKLAEETNQIFKMSYWVLEHSIKQLRIWHDQGFKDLRLSVNLSGYLFNNNDLPELVFKLLEKEKVESHFLELEITESALIEQNQKALKSMIRLKKRGITLAVDDFGTGYSNISYLREFPIDKIKIDRSFINYIIDGSAKDIAILKAIFAIGKILNLKTLAEGVENKQQIDFLRTCDCDEIQGFFISKPLKAAQCTEYLERQVII